MQIKRYAILLLLVSIIIMIPIVQSLTYHQANNVITQNIQNISHYYVDNNFSDIDSNQDKGSHSNFTAQQFGPDSIFDNLTEESTNNNGNITLINAESFEDIWLPSGWTKTVLSNWNKESDYSYDGTFSADFDGGLKGSFLLTTPDFDTSDSQTTYLEFWYIDNGCDISELILEMYDREGNWNNFFDLGSTFQENQWLFYQIAISTKQSEYFHPEFKVRWNATNMDINKNFCVDLVSLTKDVGDLRGESGYRVQQGDFLFQGTDSYIPLENAVNLTCSFVLMPNIEWQENVTAVTSGDPAMNSDDDMATAYLYNSTHIRIQRYSSDDGDLRIGWQVLECFDEEFIVQRGETSITGLTTTSFSAKIPVGVNPDNSMSWYYFRTSTTSNDGRIIQFYSNITESNAITFTRQSSTSITGYFRWIVVEWDISKIDIIAKGYTTGYGRDDSPFIENIGTIINKSQSILVFQTHAIGDDGLDTSATSGYILNNTHMAFYNYDSSFFRGIKWYVIDFGSGVGSRQETNQISWPSTDYLNDDVLNPVVQTNRTLVWLSGSCNGDGTAKPRHTQWWSLDKTNSTHSAYLHYERRYGGQNREISWQVLELPYSLSEGNNVFELDLEVQWINVDYHEANEELCIFGGSMGSENIQVDAWNGSGWSNVFSDLNSGWNNVTVTTYHTNSNFTIRFKGGTENNDSNQDIWSIDAVLLHVWS